MTGFLNFVFLGFVYFFTFVLYVDDQRYRVDGADAHVPRRTEERLQVHPAQAQYAHS